MKKAVVNELSGDLRPEYDLTQLTGGVRGKYYEQATRETSLVVIEPERSKSNGNRTRVDDELVQHAEALTQDHRKEILTSIPETELHHHLKELATLLLMLMKAGDKPVLKAINKRLRKLRDEFPKEFKLLLPPDPKQKPKFKPPVSRKK